jgi:hypothetical protein
MIMPYLAAIHWGYIALVVLILALLVASPFLLVAFRSARAIAYTGTDDFRLSNVNMWTEPQHTPDGGSIELMRLSDSYFVLISVGVSTVKVFATPDRSDITQYRELREFPVSSAFARLSQTSHQRRSDDLLLLERVRCAIGWPKSLSDLVSSIESIDSNLLLGFGTNV